MTGPAGHIQHGCVNTAFPRQRKLLQHFTEKVQEIQTEAERSHSEVKALETVCSFVLTMCDAALLPCFQLQSRLKEAEQKQTELSLSRKLLQDTVRWRQRFMSLWVLFVLHVVLFLWQEEELCSLQRRCEEQEDFWKNKVSEAEQQNQTVRSRNICRHGNMLTNDFLINSCFTHSL